jgi:circadian clock protein KaiC
VYPRIRTPETFTEYAMVNDRVSTGIDDLDKMIEGGMPRGTATMVAGGAGTGKTLHGLHFITNGAQHNEPGVIVTFQENPVQLREIARSFGWDLHQMEEDGLVAHLYQSPVEIQPDIHTDLVKQAVNKIKARRVLIDSLRDLEIATPDKVRYRDYVYSLVEDFKRLGITTLITNEISQLFGNFQLSDYGISFIADNVILLRYVELEGHITRALNVLKVRGSYHNKMIWEYRITDDGITITEPIHAVTGILVGSPVMSEVTAKVDLPPRTRYVLLILRSLGEATVDQLEEHTGMKRQYIAQELDILQEHKLITLENKGKQPIYKSTV